MTLAEMSQTAACSKSAEFWNQERADEVVDRDFYYASLDGCVVPRQSRIVPFEADRNVI
jgi:hypothetical protein